MNQISWRGKTLTLIGHIFILLLLLGASHPNLSPDMAGERLRAELLLLMEEQVSENSPLSKGQNIALKGEEIQDESFTLHKKKQEKAEKKSEAPKWLRAR